MVILKMLFAEVFSEKDMLVEFMTDDMLHLGEVWEVSEVVIEYKLSPSDCGGVESVFSV